MTIVNFSHPLTDEQLSRIAELAGTAIERVIEVPTHLADDRPFAEQVGPLVEATGLTPREWQTLPLLVNLPGYAPAAAVLLAHLHGLTGHFPTVARLRPVVGRVPAAYEVAELVGLQDIRLRAREDR